jgi:molybdopterin-synthase adenylyltransferase
MTDLPQLTHADRARYEWQMWTEGFGEAGQRRLKGASVLVSRVGGLGGPAAYELAAAGVGRIVLAHAGSPKPSDLNRQLLVTEQSLGKSRVETAASRLRDLNSDIVIEAVPENISEENAEKLAGSVDLVVDCAPLFKERYSMNAAAVRLGKPLVECGVYDLEAHLTLVVPGKTPCLACLYPEPPTWWKRQFPVFGATSGSLGCMAAMEAIKHLAGFGETLAGRMLIYDLRRLTFRIVKLSRRAGCKVCG